MPLGLDFNSSEAKVERAFEHLKTLQRELPAEYRKRGPYSVRFTPVDPQTGWCEMVLVPNPRKPRFGVIVGDIVHNLRSALDYLVTALADASSADPTKKRQFPIFLKETEYRGSVGTLANAKADGPLDGIRHGLGLIEQLQPYHTQPNPRSDALFLVHRFSNADKHREIAATVSIPVGAIDIRFEGYKVEDEHVTDIFDWTPDQEMVIHRMRFDPPVAENMRVDGSLKVATGFSVPPFRSESAYGARPSEIEAACNHLRTVVEAFKLL